jgi:hypothetical protein
MIFEYKPTMKDHSNPLSRPYVVRLKEQGFIYKVELPLTIEDYTLDDLNIWLQERGCKSKRDYVMSSWSYYFKDEKLAMWFRLKWA